MAHTRETTSIPEAKGGESDIEKHSSRTSESSRPSSSSVVAAGGGGSGGKESLGPATEPRDELPPAAGGTGRNEKAVAGALATVALEGKTTADDQTSDRDPTTILRWRRFQRGLGRRVEGWSPKRTRYDSENPPKFTTGLNLLFSAAGMVTVANLYYNQPVLYKMAETFDVSFERAASVATLMQAGYASGLLLICPLGDVFERRPFILCLMAFTAMMWLGLCLTPNFEVFMAISFICGFTTVTPQLMLPLVSDLAEPHRRASALSITVAGLSLGVMLARVLSGIIANYTHWRNIYWVGFGLQHAVLVTLYLFMPGYPSKNPEGRLSYPRVLWSIATILVSEPTLVQACLIAFCMSAVFTSYWTTLSFLLSSPPFQYSSLAIGLFGLIGFFVIVWGPPFGRLVLDRLVPLVPVVGGICVNFVGVAIGTFTGTFTVAGPIVQAILNDVGNQATNISMRTAIYGINPRAGNRVNTAFMLAAFCGQLTGTAVGNRLYAQGGWRWSGSCSLGFLGFAMVVCLVRGPREKGWFGWGGGWSPRRDEKPLTRTAAGEDLEGQSSEMVLDAGPTGDAHVKQEKE